MPKPNRRKKRQSKTREIEPLLFFTGSDGTRLRLRRASAGDIPAVYQIEIQQSSNPWKIEYFQQETTNDLARFFVVETTDRASARICAYIVFWIVAKEMELHSLAVSSEFQNRRIGSRLMQHMMDTALALGIEKIFLDVRASNQKAIHLYEKFHFQLITKRSNYYQNPSEDGLVYGLTLKNQT